LGAAIVLGVAALMAFAAAAGIIWRDSADEDEDEPAADEDESAWVSLGLLAHYLLSFQARLARMFRRSAPPRFPVSDAETPRRRLEPRMRDDLEHDAEDEDGESDEDESIAPAPRAPRKPRAAAKPARRSWGGYEHPSLGLLAAPRASERTTLSADLIRENGAALEGVLSDFGVRGEIINARPGPVVTLYELEPAPGIKSSRVIGLADDIARSMSALSARVAVVSGRNAIGIELPNPTRVVGTLLDASAMHSGRSGRATLTIAARLAKLKAGTTNTARLDQTTQYDSCEDVLPHQGHIAARSLKPPGVLATAERQNRQEKKSAHEPSGHRP
jgi:S-DNA-T family DNA segregation ATPase FtsK/SpoIIIE